MRLDTSDIRHVDILEMANAVDKVLSSGILSINEIRETIGYNVIEEEYANKHWMTKNYSLAEDMLKPALPEAPKEELPEEVKDEEEQPSDDALEGGDNDEE